MKGSSSRAHRRGDEELEVIRLIGQHGTLEICKSELCLSTRNGRERIKSGLTRTGEASEDPRQWFTHFELGPSERQAAATRQLIYGHPVPSDAVQPATFEDGLACMEVIGAVRRSAAGNGIVSTVRGREALRGYPTFTS